MAPNERLARLFGVVLWVTVVLGAQWAVGRHQEEERTWLYRDYRAHASERTPAMRTAYRDVTRRSQEAFAFTMGALTVAAGVGAAAIVFVPLRPRAKGPTLAKN